MRVPTIVETIGVESCGGSDDGSPSGSYFDLSNGIRGSSGLGHSPDMLSWISKKKQMFYLHRRRCVSATNACSGLSAAGSYNLSLESNACRNYCSVGKYCFCCGDSGDVLA